MGASATPTAIPKELGTKGYEFRTSLDFGHEIVLHKDNGDKVSRAVVDLASSCKAKVKP